MNTKEKAVVLVSGGLDSATVLAIARAEGYACYAMSFLYGQRHAIELESARRVAGAMGALKHVETEIDLRAWGGSALTDDVEVPKGRDVDSEDIPITYVPARNTIFLSFALAWAEVLGAEHIFFGANALDYSGYPDCRPDFIHAFEELARLGTKAGVEGHGPSIHAPLIDMTKADIIRRGAELGVDFSLTHSCYDPLGNGQSCGKCDSCLLRLRGFAEAGLEDPLAYG